jgi:hypothetical protein
VAGPPADGHFLDDRTRPEQTGVSLDGNAVLTGLLAGLVGRDVRPGQCNGGRGESFQGGSARTTSQNSNKAGPGVLTEQVARTCPLHHTYSDTEEVGVPCCWLARAASS